MNTLLGAPHQTYTGGDGATLCTYTGKSKTTFTDVCALLASQGFTVYSESEQNGSLFSTYQKGTELYHLYWLQDDSTLNIVHSTTAASALPVAVSPVTGGVATTVTQLKLPLTSQNIYANGMGYVIRLADGSFLIYDGGYAEQAEQLYELLIKQNGGTENIVIRAWMLTHSHGDHYGCLSEFSNRYASLVEVETFLIAPVQAADASDTYLNSIFPDVAARFSGAEICTVHTGMRFRFCNLTMEILLAPDEVYIDYAGKAKPDFNNSSIVSRLVGDGDGMLFLGDAPSLVTDRLTSIYGNALQTNQCQVAHHGVGDSTAAFYNSLSAKVLWYPCGEKLYSWTELFADNLARNGAVRQALAESGNYEILLHDGCLWQKVWGSNAPAQAFPLT